MASESSQKSTPLAVVFLVGAIAGIAYVTIPDDPVWPMYVYLTVTVFGALFWGFKAVRQ